MGTANEVALDSKNKTRSPLRRSGNPCPLEYFCYVRYFWSYHWLHGQSLENLPPNVHKCVPPKVWRTRNVAEALHKLTWVSDIKGALDWHGLAEYLQLWDTISDITLNILQDVHLWKFESSGIFSTKSAYRAFFRVHHIWTLEVIVEVLGSTKMKNFYLVSHPELLLNSWPVAKKRTTSPGPLPVLRPRRRNGTTHLYNLCICQTILVRHLAALEPGRIGP